MAENGLTFLEKYGRDSSGNWYFSLDQKGSPLIQPYNIFSDCFACMAFGAAYRIAPLDAYAEIARQSFSNILSRRENPKGRYNKSYPGTRELRSFALPMILCNLALELEHLLDPAQVDSITAGVVALILEEFYDPTSGLIREYINTNGTQLSIRNRCLAGFQR